MATTHPILQPVSLLVHVAAGFPVETAIEQVDGDTDWTNFMQVEGTDTWCPDCEGKARSSTRMAMPAPALSAKVKARGCLVSR